MQAIESISPLTYVFEYLRQNLINGMTAVQLAPMLIKMFALLGLK